MTGCAIDPAARLKTSKFSDHLSCGGLRVRFQTTMSSRSCADAGSRAAMTQRHSAVRRRYGAQPPRRSLCDSPVEAVPILMWSLGQ